MSIRSKLRPLGWTLAEAGHLLLDVSEALMKWYAPLPPTYLQTPRAVPREQQSPLVKDGPDGVSIRIAGTTPAMVRRPPSITGKGHEQRRRNTIRR
jgi:hypothetical protein